MLNLVLAVYSLNYQQSNPEENTSYSMIFSCNRMKVISNLKIRDGGWQLCWIFKFAACNQILKKTHQIW